MTLIFCGPPHSGKTVIIDYLEKFLPADSFKTISVTKDGEGRWSNNKNQDEVQKVRVKESFDEKFIALKCEEIKRAEQQIVLVDIGGKILPDKIPLFELCDCFLILSREKELIAEWRAFGTKYNCNCIAELFSDLETVSSVEENDGFFRGVAGHLHRGSQPDNPEFFQALADYIVKKAGYCVSNQSQDFEHVCDFNQMALKMGRAELSEVNGNKVITNVRFLDTDGPEIFNNIKDISLNQDYIKFFAARANWVVSVASFAARKGGIKKIYLYDTNFADYIPVTKMKIWKTKSDVLEFSVLESKSEVLLDVFCTKDVLYPDEMQNIKLPYINPNKKLYVSGKIPNWLTVSINASYKNKEKFVFQPGNSFICVESEDLKKIGTTINVLESIDTNMFFSERKMEKEKKGIVYFDMDRVLVNFGEQAEKYNILKKNTRINWWKVFFLGTKFWSEMDFYPNAKESFDKIATVCKEKSIQIKILSSVKLNSGRKGKILWCKEKLNIPERRINLEKDSRDKALYAGRNCLLIDDSEENVSAFIANGGKGYILKEWNETSISQIISIIDEMIGMNI